MAKKKSRGSIVLKGLLLLLPVVAIAGYVSYSLTVKSHPKPSSVTGLEADSQSGEMLYEVPAKANLKSLSLDLENKGLIPNATVFKIFLRVTRQDKKIRAGYFYVRPSNSVLEMTFKLTSGKMATQMVTIPEGKTSWEIFSILKAKFPLDTLKFDSLVHSRDFAKACDLEAPSLEGYIFPDTYVLPWRVTEKDALKAMVQHFLRVSSEMDRNTPFYKQHGLTGWVTLASIVEKEAAVPQEQELIAGVFNNRLKLGWTLGADPTVRFAVHKPTGVLYVSDLENNSPYNTRKFTGLPPGPICNPGRGALRASVNPMSTDKMFFVAKDDGSREHFFSIDNSQHLKFKDIALSNRIRRGLENTGSHAPVKTRAAGKNR